MIGPASSWDEAVAMAREIQDGNGKLVDDEIINLVAALHGDMDGEGNARFGRMLGGDKLAETEAVSTYPRLQGPSKATMRTVNPKSA